MFTPIHEKDENLEKRLCLSRLISYTNYIPIHLVCVFKKVTKILRCITLVLEVGLRVIWLLIIVHM